MIWDDSGVRCYHRRNSWRWLCWLVIVGAFVGLAVAGWR